MNPKFPLYRNDGRASVYINSFQRQALKNFVAKLDSGVYHLEDNPCMCGAHDDVAVTEKDRYGFPCRYVLCRNCGLVRLEKRLDDESTALFYRDDYRSIYEGSEQPQEKYFRFQERRGDLFYSIIDEYADISSVHSVFEVGCGAGGILYAFHKRGIKASGCDFGEKYLSAGRAYGLDLYEGELDLTKTPPNSQDVVILSHVLEHLNNPIDYVNKLAEMISPDGLLLVQVPGMLSIGKQYVFPIRYFQNAHVNNFYGHYLKRFFTTLGFEVVYGDEECTFIMRKPKGWIRKDTGNIIMWDEDMPQWSQQIEYSLKKDYLLSYIRRSGIKLRRCIVRVLDILHIKGYVKRLLKS